MKIFHVTDNQIQLEIEGKGHFDIMLGDFGGSYPGIDVEFVPEKGLKSDLVSGPRVVFEFPEESDGPEVKIWEDAHSEDYTESVSFSLSDYEEIQQPELDRE